MSSQAVLLKEYKALSKEKWVEIEVSIVDHRGSCVLTGIVERRECVRVESGSYRHQPRFVILWRLLQGSDELSQGLPIQAAW